MRIAISGTHRTGKSTLVEELGGRLPGYRTVPEPYELLEERGYEFAFPPTVEDFAAQLQQSLTLLRRPIPRVIFDRCPLDFIGYILATPGGERFDIDRRRGQIAAAMASLDLIVFIPIDPGHDAFGGDDDAVFRAAVDLELRDLIEDDSLDLVGDTPVLTVAGPWEHRSAQVLTTIGILSHP